MPQNPFDPNFVERYFQIIDEETKKFDHYEYFERFFAFDGDSSIDEIIDFFFDGERSQTSEQMDWEDFPFPRGRNRNHYKLKSVLKRVINYIEGSDKNRGRSLFSADSLFIFLKKGLEFRCLSGLFIEFLLAVIKACAYFALNELMEEKEEKTELDPEWPVEEGMPGDRFYYRGIGDYSWKLKSSFYRKKIEGMKITDPIYVDHEQLSKYYRAATAGPIPGMSHNPSLTDRYELCFDKSEVDYDFIAWMQHSSENSPFIDFTKSRGVAIYFALGEPGAPVKYPKAGVYILDASKSRGACRSLSEVNEHIEEMQLFFLKSRIGPFSKITASALMDPGTKKTFSLGSLPAFISRVVPSYDIIDIPTNDRMKVQKGVFVFFHKAIFVNEEPFALVSKQKLYLTKRPIDALKKSDFMGKLIKSNPIFDDGYLMDPYKIFK